MPPLLAVGDVVQTALGKGVVREVRRHGRVLVEVKGRPLEVEAASVTRLEAPSPKSKRRRPSSIPDAASTIEVGASRDVLEVDLHGLTVDAALARIEEVINDALLGDRAQIRFIHGQTGGRIRGALQQRLRAISTVRAFHLDPRNPGVTIVVL